MTAALTGPSLECVFYAGRSRPVSFDGMRTCQTQFDGVRIAAIVQDRVYPDLVAFDMVSGPGGLISHPAPKRLGLRPLTTLYAGGMDPALPIVGIEVPS